MRTFAAIPPLTDKDKVRFWGNVDRSGECWEWVGYTNKGRGYITVRNKKCNAARVAWQIAHGENPGDLCVCHTCDNALCVNPGHLWLGTQLDNIRDRDSKGRQRSVVLTTHCRRGHEFTEDNLYYHPGKLGKSRTCRKCIALTKRAWNEARKRGAKHSPTNYPEGSPL